MLLTVDVGNTNISCGVFDEDKLVTTYRFLTDSALTPDELALKLHAIMEVRGLLDSQITGAIVSSVVPGINKNLITAIRDCFGVDPVIVSAASKMAVGLPSREPGAIGADLIVDVVAAYRRIRGECLVVDFGTATKFLYVSPQGEFKYCVIAPGLEKTAATLWNATAQLPEVELAAPGTVLTDQTVRCMQAGIMYGYEGLTNGIIERFVSEIGHSFPILATGGLGRYLVNSIPAIDSYEPQLAYYGMRELYKDNRK